MQVTNLKQKGKSQEYFLEIDNLPYGTLQLETIYKHKIQVGTNLNEDEFKQIKEEDGELSCFSCALKYISSRLKTEYQMKQYLLQKGYCLSTVEKAILKLKDYGYLNDEYFAKTFIELESKNKGKRYLKQQLFLKGVNSQIVEDVILDNNDEQACKNVCQKWLRSKEQPLTQKDKEKLYRFLLSRGFEYDTIKHTTGELFTEE